ncbi:MAG: polymer-forming cytoskeletal protein [Myxococcales bacterium]|nr:polymer-forming cytoskeletal protein [Myxococcales bacterium]
MIGPGTTVRGTISGDEDLTIEGRVEGAIRLRKALDVAEGAVVAADVEATTVQVSGRVEGAVQASARLVVDAGAVLVGDVRTPTLSVADGAHFKGRVEMDFDIPGGVPTRPAGRRR